MAAFNPRIISSALIVLFLLMTIGLVYSLSIETHDALKGAVQEKLIAVAITTASQIDGDAHSRLRPGDENTADYRVVRDQLRAVKAASGDIRYIYTMQLDDGTVKFVVDADYGIDPDTPLIGTPYPEAGPDLRAGFDGPSADREFTTDEWGTVLSGYAPIRNREGAVVGLVGVDMESTVVSSKLDYLNLLFYGIGFGALIAVMLALVVIERRRIIDERRIEESERKYRLLFERAGDAIFLLDAGGPDPGTIISTNETAAQMHGYARDEMIGTNIIDFHAPGNASGIQERLLQIPKERWVYGEAMHHKKDGSIFPVEYSAGQLDLGTVKLIFVICRDITDRRNADDALQQLSSKLNLLNSVTFNDIQNAVFTLNGFIALGKTGDPARMDFSQILARADESSRKITRTLEFAKNYQDLGARPPRWQDVNHAFIMGISHLDFSTISRDVKTDGLEIYADSLLERVFYSLADNVLRHARGATQVTVSYEKHKDDLIIIFADNGPGIPKGEKENIFSRGYGTQKGMELFLVREILGITGIAISETGVPGRGARFEMRVPKGGFRFSRNDE